ncbi:SDR family NAD(P)-dependent oxidoreductase [Sphingomonas crocodyli]|nr:SDR family oxidoreductase [Sphingomonas crocodyli]
MIDLHGRTAIITGGARGLGRVMTLALAEAGANVIITAMRSPDQIAETEAQAADLPGSCKGILADMSNASDCRRVAEAALLLTGRIDILVNNAARGSREQRAEGGERPRFWEADEDAIERMVATNLAGPYLMARAVVPTMIAQGYGRIINISTSRTTMRLIGGGPYGPTKAAIEAATNIWARELAGTGVTANALLPGGASDTDLIPGDGIGTRAVAFIPGKDEPGQEGSVPGGLLPPWIMGPPIVWLASDASADFNGRRFVARDWDVDLPPDQAAMRAMQPPCDRPVIM